MARYIYDKTNHVEIPVYGSGGHTIKDSTGTSLTQRTNLKFNNATVTDDPLTNTTVVTPVGGGATNFVGTLAEWEALTQSEKNEYDSVDLIDDYSDVADEIEALTNKHNVVSKEVDTTGWTANTTSQVGTTLYKKSIALSHVYVESPSVNIGATGVLPTAAQQEAYNLLQYVTVDSAVPCLYLYASDTPTTSFYINVEGVD